MTDLILQSYHVLDEFKSSETYQQIIKLDQVIMKTYQVELDQFNQAKAAYDKVMQEGGPYHPDYKEAVKTLSETKKALYEKEEVALYMKLEKELQEEINQFLADITQLISPHIKTPDKYGIVKKGGSCHVG